jgi:hypothetical protein
VEVCLRVTEYVYEKGPRYKVALQIPSVNGTFGFPRYEMSVFVPFSRKDVDRKNPGRSRIEVVLRLRLVMALFSPSTLLRTLRSLYSGALFETVV